MPRRTLLLLALVASVANAQTPADTAGVARDSVAVMESVVLKRSDARLTEHIRVDSVLLRTQEGTPARYARLAFPTEGGVFYYRAGSGSAIRRVQRTPAERPNALPELAETSTVAPSVPDRSVAPPPSRIEGRRQPAGERPVAQAAPSSVTQSDLDRLERRLLDALNRRLDRESRSSQPVPVVVPRADDARSEGRRVDRPVETSRPPVTPVPVSPGDSLRPVPVSPPSEEPEVTAEEVERALLDTGLFRTTRIFFAFGKADLLPISQQNLNTISDVLLRYPAFRIEVGGHTDAISSGAFNLALSQRRAGAVASYLISRGIDADRITAVGYGEARPVASNETDTGRALNRRVEFVMQDEQ